MQVQVNPTNVTETVAVVGSALLGLIVLSALWRDLRGRLFGILCLFLAAWKAFDFAHPLLTREAWVDAVSWGLGALCVALAVQFFATYSLGEGRITSILYTAAFPVAAVFMTAAALGVLTPSNNWKAAFGAYLVLASVLIVALMAREYGRIRDRQHLLALLGAVAITLGACLQVADIIWDLWGLRFQTYGMLVFEACFAYDILVTGFLRAKAEHMQALEELGLRERRLQEAEARFRKMLDNSYDVIFTMDREGNILAINTDAEEVLGLPVQRVLGKGYLDFLDPKDVERAFSALARGLEGEKIRFFEVTLRRPDGRPVILSLTGTRLYTEKEAALVIARDVTQSREMELELMRRNALLEEANRRLSELDRLKTELVGIVGHELRSPLTVINSYASALKDHWDRMEEDRKLSCIDHVLRECRRLNRMVENVLDMSRIESDQAFLNRRRGDLVSVLQEVAGSMSHVPGARNVHLVTSVRRLDMEADWDKVRQVLINLLDNAFRFSPPGAPVMVTGDVQNGEAVVRVKDRGPGIPPEDRERLFDKFTRSKVEGMEGGLGLGLYIVRTYVEAHGGRVWVEDEEGMGAVVAFSLPLQEKGDPGREYS
ncbi:ATP-binding protein [Candidatus Solincola sp.]|nr:ATP-binding protein [Actinomycetota bacterium]MDI7252828.1 ATP-binding protein [Actinomycetota bacterium]